MLRKDILTMNDRNYSYVSQNTRSAMKLADDKLATKELMIQNNIATPGLYKVFHNRSDITKYDFSKLPDDFVIKPNAGLGGEGIIVIVKRKNATTFMTAGGDEKNIGDIKKHIIETLEGSFSISGTSDICFIEQRLILDPIFHDICYKGIPDIRVIVYRGVPVMSMIRLPTKRSDGKANLHLGGVGAGIDINTGITNCAVMLGKPIEINPDTGKTVIGVTIPHWNKVLEIAILSQKVSGISYLGADIVIDQHVGPVILELNARPGLAIQISNMQPLKKRLMQVENEKPQTLQESIEIAKKYFSN